MGDLIRWVVQRHEAEPADAELAVALELLEASFAAGQPDDRELIAASFLENLPRGDEHGAAVRRLLGPSLHDHLERFG